MQITESQLQGMFRQICSLEQKLALQEVQDTIKTLARKTYSPTVNTVFCMCVLLNTLASHIFYVSSENIYLHELGTAHSCKISNVFGQVSDQYCNMDLVGCGSEGGWMRVANLDMTQPNQECPPGFRNFTASGKRLCGRPGPGGCVSVKFPTNNNLYSRVSGRVIAYQDKSPDAQCPYTGRHTDKQSHTLEEVYIDGVSITHGSPRQHIWSFVASSLVTSGDCHGCKCYSQDTVTVTRVPFIGRKFFCDSGTETHDSGTVFHPTNPLWDGQGCSQNNGCCTFNNPPWFCSELDQRTSDDIELRLCADEPTHNEDIPIEIIELYVQ